MSEEHQCKKTPLYEEHVKGGGRMVEFAGFKLPVQYTSLEEEHNAVRNAAGLFDVSHMGEILVRGEHAMDFVQMISCNDHGKLAVGRAQYTGLMYPEGTFVDDMLVHRLAEDEFLLVVNAANLSKDFAYLSDLASEEKGVEVIDQSGEYAQIAIQGPRAIEILQELTAYDLASIRYYRFVWNEVIGHKALIARTGYTGEDGFEVYVSPEHAPGIWQAIVTAGSAKGLKLAGLGARDTLRFEAGMSLYGHEIDQDTTPLEAGLGWIVKVAKGDFIGRDVLVRQLEEGVEKKLVGLEMIDRGIARHGYDVYLEAEGGEPVGIVTTGTQSPTLGKALANAFLPAKEAEEGREVFVQIRKRRLKARIIPTGFYKRKKS